MGHASAWTAYASAVCELRVIRWPDVALIAFLAELDHLEVHARCEG